MNRLSIKPSNHLLSFYPTRRFHFDFCSWKLRANKNDIILELTALLEVKHSFHNFFRISWNVVFRIAKLFCFKSLMMIFHKKLTKCLTIIILKWCIETLKHVRTKYWRGRCIKQAYLFWIISISMNIVPKHINHYRKWNRIVFNLDFLYIPTRLLGNLL